MVTTLPASQMTYIATVIGLVTLLMNGVAALLEMFPAMKANGNLFNWTLRAINIVLSVAGVCAAEATLGTFDLHNWVAYILTALGSAVGSTALYAVTTARHRAKIARLSAQLADTPNPWPAPTPGTPVYTPDGKNSLVAFQPAGVTPQ